MGKRPIASQKSLVAKQDKLPFSIVHYPGFYGSFFGFQVGKESPIVFCSCAKGAINNYLTFRLSENWNNADPTRNFILDSMYFPLKVVKRLLDKDIPQNRSIISYLTFEDKICHECNNVLPKYRYCSEMYGSKFKQNYGWYIIKQGYAMGVQLINTQLLPNSCSQEVLDAIEIDLVKTRERLSTLRKKQFSIVQSLSANEIEELRSLESKLSKQERKIWNVVENVVRQRFGHHKIGEMWTSETILYNLISSIYPDYTNKRHIRPDFFEGLELDIFIPKKKVGIEYQGIQHYKPVEFWGGEEGLKRRKKRDQEKQTLCRENGVELLCFKYNEELSEKQVKQELDAYLK